VNDKFLPAGGTDLWSHYPAPGAFAEDLQTLPGVPAQPPASRIDQPAANGATPAPAGEDYMIGSPRAAGAPDPADRDEGRVAAPEEEAGERSAARARYEEAVAALDERSYDMPFTDSTMAPPVH
jgi:hypothetical protein